MSDQLTPERWEAARKILAGETNHAVSWSAAAQAAGVRIRDVRAWIDRAREQRPEDDPWVHAIADDAEQFVESQAGRLEDKLWAMATDPKRPKPAVALTMLRARDDRYNPQDKGATVTVTLSDQASLFQRLTAGKRVLEAERESMALEQNEEGVYVPTAQSALEEAPSL